MASTSFGGYDEERFADEVDDRLFCPICMKVFKDPVLCPNEHYFCRSCIRKCFREASETCPTCQHHLTEETLAIPARFFMETLERLKIRCEHASRGCREVVELEFLDRHVETCGFSPTPCTNTGCFEVIDQHEQERHENELCRFRRIVCDECEEQVIWKSRSVHICFMRKEIDDLVKERENQNEFNRRLMADIARQNVVIDDLSRRNEEVECIAKEATERCDFFTGRRKIYVCGGRDNKCIPINSVESFSWPGNAWALEPAMIVARSTPAAFVYEEQIYVTGGRIESLDCTDSIEELNAEKDKKEWLESCVKMPIKCNGHGMVCYKSTAILTGGRDRDNVSNEVHKIELTPPYTRKSLPVQLPEERCFHGCQIIDSEIVVAGGRTSTYLRDTKNTVYLYDINSDECKTLPPLPFPISDMATVSYKGNIILIGGVNEKGETLNSVFMYEVKTGRIKMLPSLNYKRSGSAAVITGNVIIVMGGHDIETETYLNSVEYLDLSTNVWKELSPMIEQRSFATAVLY